MEMHQIRYFLSVSRTLNFTRAAEACNVTQPSLTRAIQLLEAELGGELFRRERNLTHLTDLGKRTLPQLQRCYDAAVEAKAVAQRFVKAGGLTIAVATCVGTITLTRHLKVVAQNFPGVEISLHRVTPSEAHEALKRGDVDVAISESADCGWDRLESYRLASEHLSVVVNAGHPFAEREEIEPAALAGERILHLPGTSTPDCLASAVNGAASAVRREVATLDDIIVLLGVGAGVALLPEGLAVPAALVRVEIGNADTEVAAFLHLVAGRRHSPALQTLIRSVRTQDRGASAPQPGAVRQGGPSWA